MNMDAVRSAFSCPLPEYFSEYLEDFRAQYRRDDPLLPDASVDAVRDATGVPEGCVAMIRDVRNELCADPVLHKAAALFLYVTVFRRKPWENRVYTDDVLHAGNFHVKSVNLFFVACALANTLLVKRPPADLNETNLDAFRGYTAGCFGELGVWGINEFHWNMLCAGGCMFMQGALKFCPGYFTDDFPVFTDGKEFFSTVAGVFGVTEHGELTADESQAVTHTVFEETEETVRCNRIAKDGTVSLVPETLSKSVWKDYLRGGTPTLDIHIPSHMDYRPEVLLDAYRKAIPFYRSFYPDHEVKAVSGYSWIFSPQLRLVLGSGSRILAVMDSMHILPTTETYGSDLRFLRPGSSLAERIGQVSAAGRPFHFAVMYVPVSEIGRF